MKVMGMKFSRRYKIYTKEDRVQRSTINKKYIHIITEKSRKNEHQTNSTTNISFKKIWIYQI